MPLVSQQAAAGTDLDGTAANGLLAFGLGAREDLRAELHSWSVSSAVATTTVHVVMAPSLAQYTAGEYMQLGYGENTQGISAVGCGVLVPPLWVLLAITTGATAAIKYLTVDWRRITPTPYQ